MFLEWYDNESGNDEDDGDQNDDNIEQQFIVTLIHPDKCLYVFSF